MGLYFLTSRDEFSLLPAIIIGWEDGEDFYIEIGWLNVFFGVNFG